MSALIPFRPWKFANGDSDPIFGLLDPERKTDDRSPFVRYARSAALWAEWVRDGTVVQEEEARFPIVESSGYSFKLAVAALDDLSPLMSVPPSAKEHRQRLLEGVLLYAKPIVVVEKPGGGYTVVANHELFEAARAYQADLARPGKVKSSDHGLIAIADPSFLETLHPHLLGFDSSKDEEDIFRALGEIGYALSPRTDDLNTYQVQVEHQPFVKAVESGSEWKRQLATAIGVKSLDSGVKLSPSSLNSSGKKIVLTSPKVTKFVLEKGTEYPYGSVAAEIMPPTGAMMWNLRDF